MSDPYTFLLPVHVVRHSDNIEVGYEDRLAPKIEEVVDPVDDLDLNRLDESIGGGVKDISYTHHDEQGMYKITMNKPIRA